MESVKGDGGAPTAGAGGVWYLARGGRPFQATAKKQDEGVVWFAREGDTEWHPIADLHRRVKEKSGSTKV